MSTPEPLSKLVERWEARAKQQWADGDNGQSVQSEEDAKELASALQAWRNEMERAEREWRADKTIVHTLLPLTETAFVVEKILGSKPRVSAQRPATEEKRKEGGS